ncbi:GNAT family N-acetyltransferase [Virgibacillus halodenitrificans]|uniref:GNAT family N-acetyltransferase n=1 Tax=Virgibacillus halodenitrificans TaxID=1482 RepID=UPI002DBB1A80|nr:GNAT family N-acetyltransferase [Virgibacillus halodenitrificans]MEC2158710.1 GNAT family N-acetyltransferase [Virgibacillus halodenitrificans]
MGVILLSGAGRFHMLETARCRLVDISEQDCGHVKQLYSNKEVRKFLGGPIQEASIKNSFAKMLTSNTSDVHLTVKEKNTDQFIGLISLDMHHDGISTEVSYQFLPFWWGKGIAREVVAKLIDYAFNEMQISQLVAETQAANQRSCALLESVGMQVKETVFRFGKEQFIYCLNNKKLLK